MAIYKNSLLEGLDPSNTRLRDSQAEWNLTPESKWGAPVPVPATGGTADPASLSHLYDTYSHEPTTLAGTNPKPPDDASGWKTVTDSLYSGKRGAPQTSDVEQGGDGASGTCWLLATLAAYAHAGIPGQMTLQNMISEGKNGSYDVTLYNPAMAGNRFQYNILPGSSVENVTPEFPVDTAGWLSADPNPRDQSAMWAAIIEKAVAQKMGGDYANMYGNDPALAMALISGEMPKMKRWNYPDPNNPQQTVSLSEEEALKMIMEGQKTNSPMVAGTIGNGFDHALGENKNLDGQHAYSVLGTVQHDDKTFVKLYNPFGFADSDDTLAEQKKAKDPYVEVTLSDFVKTFQSIAVGQAVGKRLQKCVDAPPSDPRADRDYAAGDVICKN